MAYSVFTSYIRPLGRLLLLALREQVPRSPAKPLCCVLPHATFYSASPPRPAHPPRRPAALIPRIKRLEPPHTLPKSPSTLHELRHLFPLRLVPETPRPPLIEAVTGHDAVRPAREVQEPFRVRRGEEERQGRGVRLERGDFGEVFQDAGDTEEVVRRVGEVVDCCQMLHWGGPRRVGRSTSPGSCWRMWKV